MYIFFGVFLHPSFDNTTVQRILYWSTTYGFPYHYSSGISISMRSFIVAKSFSYLTTSNLSNTSTISLSPLIIYSNILLCTYTFPCSTIYTTCRVTLVHESNDMNYAVHELRTTSFLIFDNFTYTIGFFH